MATRQLITLRLSPGGIETLNRKAQEHQLHRTQVMRAALSIALRHEKELDAELRAMEKRL